MKPPNKRKLIITALVGLFAVAFVFYVALPAAYDAGMFERERGRAKYHYVPGYFEQSIEKAIPGFLVARLELRGFANPVSDEERKVIRDDVMARAKAEGLLRPDHREVIAIETCVVPNDGTVRVAYGYLVSPYGMPHSMSGSANEGAVASSHQWARQWLEEEIRRLTEHLYNRQSITRVVPGVFAGRLELRPLADALSTEEKEALRNDVIALAKAEGFLGTEPPGSERGTGRRGAKRPFAARVVNKLGPHHVAYGYVVDSDGKQWTLEIAVNNEKEGAGFHQSDRDWLGVFEGKGTGKTSFMRIGDESSILR